MKKFSFARHTGFSLTALAVALAGCSSGSNLINGGAGSSTANTYSECTGSDCVSVQFLDEPVQGLDYSCDSVRNVTDVQGIAKCPVNSIITYSVRNLDAKHGVKLGSAKVESISNGATNSGMFLRLTPRDIAPGVSNLTSLNESGGIAATNIVRFLQLFADTPYNTEAPINRLVITTEKKQLLDSKLVEDIVPGDFGSNAFETKLKPYLTTTGKTLIDSSAAQGILMDSLQAIKAGSYQSTPVISTFSGASIDLGTSGSGITGAGASSHVTMGLFTIVNRKGQTMGQGMHWQNTTAKTSDEIYNIYLSDDFVKLRLTPGAQMFDPISHYLATGNNAQRFAWVTDTSAATPLKVNFTRGRLVRNLVMPSNGVLYSSYTGESVVPQDALGAFIQPAVTTGANPQPVYNGTSTFTKTTQIDSFLNPAVWKTATTVASGETYQFPLHLSLQFYYFDKAQCATTACKLGNPVGITILADGDIISDKNNNCAATDSSLIDQTDPTVTEDRLGTVRTVFTENSGGNKVLSFSLMLSNPAYGPLDGIQIGTDTVAPRVKIYLDALSSAAAGTGANLNLAAKDGTTQTSTDAIWANVYNNYQSLHINYLMNKDSNYVPSDAEKLIQNTAQGTFTVKTAACYAVKARS